MALPNEKQICIFSVLVGPQIQFLEHPGMICYFSLFMLLLMFGALLSMRPVATHCSDKLVNLIVALTVLIHVFDHSSKDTCERHTGNFDQTVMQSLHHLVSPGL